MNHDVFLNKYWSLVCNVNFNLDHLLIMQSEGWEIFYQRHRTFDSFVNAKRYHKRDLEKAASLEQVSEKNLPL